MIISKRFLGEFKPHDTIPSDYFDDEQLQRHIKSGRVVVVADDEPTEEKPNYNDMTASELRDLVKSLGLKAGRSKKAMVEALNGNS